MIDDLLPFREESAQFNIFDSNLHGCHILYRYQLLPKQATEPELSLTSSIFTLTELSWATAIVKSPMFVKLQTTIAPDKMCLFEKYTDLHKE